MNILITNDDGISSKGILALEKELSKKYNTFLIAPLKERSVTSMAMTVYDKLRVEKINPQHVIVDGFPVDCVNIGLHGNVFPKIDLVVSGINRGVNLGYDVHYSGTVGAARHAAIHGILSLAVSSGRIHPEDDYEKEAVFIREFLETHWSVLYTNTVYSINFPPDCVAKLENLVPAKLGVRKYFDSYTVNNIIEGISEFYLGGSELGHLDQEGTDFRAYFSGKIPITALSLSQTHDGYLEAFSKDKPKIS